MRQDHSTGRTCNKCSLFKPPEAFLANARADGTPRLRSVCKACGSYKKTENTEPKTCPACRRTKPAAAFGRNGTFSYCRACANERRSVHRQGAGRAAHNKRAAAYQRTKYLNDPLYRKKAAARRAVYTALKTGRLVRPATCSKCGEPRKLHAHHHNGYEKEHHLDVIWVCVRCHRAEDFPNDPVRLTARNEE